GDVDALRNIATIIGSGAIDEALELSAARSLGQSISRLAEWQLTLFNTHMFEQLLDTHADTSPDELRKIIDDLVQRMSRRAEDLQSYVWRRHLVATTERSVMRPQGAAPTRDVVV